MGTIAVRCLVPADGTASTTGDKGEMATIADVATRARVGAGTVSRVLNGSPQVSTATRDRVLAAIEALDYRPNPMAQGLPRGRCRTVGAVVPFFTHPSAVERLRGVVAALQPSRYDFVLFNVESPLHSEEHFASLRRRDRADGLLVISLPPPEAALDALTAAGVPVVLVDARGADVPVVATDDVEGGRLATRHLIELGHERIAFIGDEPDNDFGFASSAARELGYRRALSEAGLEVRDDRCRYGPHASAVGQRLAADLLATGSRPTAVFAASDVLAMGVLAAARDAGLQVPDDLSVVGFDDIELARYVGLTTVRQPLFESGLLGAQLLLDALDEPTPQNGVVHELTLELIERATTAPPKAGRAQ